MRRAAHWTLCLTAGAILVATMGTGAPLRAAETTSAPAANMGTGAANSAGPIPIYTKDDAPSAPKLEELPLKESVSQYGITWTFEKPARVGQFINGDYYVVGPVTVKAIDPRPLFGEEVKDAPRGKTEASYKPLYARNGSTLNLPAVVPPNSVTKRTSRSGFDSRMDMAAYDSNQFTPLPIAMKAGDSLVSSASNEKDDTYPIKAVAILTCVAEPQPPDAFRPSFCQSATCKPYLARNLRRDLLLTLPRPASAAKVNPREYASWFQEPWIDTVGYGRAMPRKKFQFYGPEVANAVGDCSLLLLLDYPAQDKELLLVNMVQTGIDLFGLLRGGATWPAAGGGGGDAGRKWAILFAGLVLDDPQMSALSKSFPDSFFLEDEETLFCPIEFLGKKYEKSWTGAKVVWCGHYGSYKGKLRAKDMGNYGPTDLVPPGEWSSPWNVGSEGYRRGMTSPAWVAQALAAHLMHAEKLWDHEPFFAYEDRWMTEDDKPILAEMMKNAETKLAAAKTDAEKKALEGDKDKITKAVKGGTISGRPELSAIVKDLWDKYRNNLPAAPDGSKVPPAETTWK